MINHNLKLALRHMLTKKLYASVILLSLTVGFVCSNLLISFLISETSTDSFHSKRHRTFQLLSNDPFDGSGRIAYMGSYLNEYITANYAEVEDVCQIFTIDGLTLSSGKIDLSDMVTLMADSSFFTMFDFPVTGSARDHLLGRGSIVLSKAKAMALFGTPDAVGDIVAVASSDTTLQLVVSGVVEDARENSHLAFDAVVHHTVFPERWKGGATYVLLTDEKTARALESRINSDTLRPGLLGPGNMDYFLAPLNEAYFNADNKLSFMKTRSAMFINVGYVVCGLILFIASFNFINLFLLFWQSRKKEVGIRKTLGITTGNLFSFSVTEAGVYILTACGLSLLLTFALIPGFNTVFEARLTPEYFLNINVAGAIAAIVFLSGVLVVVLSVSRQMRMKPVSLLSKGPSKVAFSRLLFTVQFMISITLTVCAVTIIRQMNFIENAPLGFNRHILQLNAPNKLAAKNLAALKQKIGMIPSIDHVTVCSGNPVSGNIMLRYDLGNGEFYSPYVFSGDEDFLKTLDLELIEGTPLGHEKNARLVNEKLVQYFDMKDPVGQRVPGTDYSISGVVRDFTCSSFKQEIPPVIISLNNEGQALLVDFKRQPLGTLLPQIQTQWQEVFPDDAFSYRVIQDDLMKKYKDDTFFYRIIMAFSLISMILSCFGLFALSWAVVQSRSKEMGIRKVLGATAVDILNLLTMTFTKRIAVAFILATPIAYYLMEQWLTRFVSRIDLNLWIFATAALVVTLVAIATLSLQTVKATLTNPVEEIRNE